MWFYLWVHVVYHLTRWFPKNNRRGIRVVLMAFSMAFMVPQLIVLLSKESQQFCERGLLNDAIVSLCFTIVMIGFSFLLSIMEPVVWQVKAGFHVYGCGCLLFTIFYALDVFYATTCRTTTPGLYYLSASLAILALVATGILAVVLPFWLLDWLKPKWILNKHERAGICYEPVACCSCVWHV